MSALKELTQLIGDLEDSTYYDEEDYMIHCIYCKATGDYEEFDEATKKWVPVPEFKHKEDCQFVHIKKLAASINREGE